MIDTDTPVEMGSGMGVEACRIPVVLASDLGYLIPTIVALDSIYQYSNEPADIDAYIIVPDADRALFDLSVRQVAERYGVEPATLLSPSRSYDDAFLAISHISSATFYRLALPDLLPHLDRCIYLDGDIVVRGDLRELLNSLQDSDLIAGVRAAGYYWPDSGRAYHERRLELPELDAYVNAGVLVMNLRLMRELNCAQEFDALVDQAFESQDQDILNKVCHSRIRVLPPRFNLMTKYKPSQENSFEDVACIKRSYSESDWTQAQKSPLIIHYADRRKPWCDDQMDFATLWWDQADESMGYVDAVKAALPIVRKNLQDIDQSRAKLQESEAESMSLEKQLSAECEKMKNASTRLDELEAELAKAKLEIEKAKLEIKKGEKRVSELAKKEALLNSKIQDIYASRTWRMGRLLLGPAIAARRLIRRIGGKGE